MGSAQFSGAGLSAECYVPHAHCSPIAHKDVNFVTHKDVNFVNSSPRDLASEMSTQNARCMVAEPFFCFSKRITFCTTYDFFEACDILFRSHVSVFRFAGVFPCQNEWNLHAYFLSSAVVGARIL